MEHYKLRASITPKNTKSVDLLLKDIRKYPANTPELEAQINKRILSGDDSARDELVTSNLRICVSLAKQYQGKGVELEDLISAGMLGLITASKKYDPNQGVKFISYAVWWIRDAILKEILDHGKVIRIPTDKVTKFNRINKAIAQFEQENSRPPSMDELAEMLEMEESIIKDILAQSTVSVVPETITNQDGELESLFETLYIEEGNTDQKLKNQSASTTILDFLKRNLNDTEYEVITKYFGFNGPEISLEVIGEQNNITKERVRQIKDKAINKLRKSDGVSLLANFL